jgi:hypothetical protein
MENKKNDVHYWFLTAAIDLGVVLGSVMMSPDEIKGE